MEYYCTLRCEDSLYGVEFPDVPSVITVGSSVDEALAMAEEALNGALASDVGQGLPLPIRKTLKGDGRYPVQVAPHILVAAQLRELRGERSQTEIAQRLGFSYQAYQRLENPVKGNPTVKTLERIARALGKTLEVRIA